MGMGNVVLLTQVTFFLIIFVLSFFIFIPLSVYKSQFDNHCLLFADGEWHHNTTSGNELKIHWGDPGYCNFPIAISILTVPLSLFYVLWMSVYLFKDVDVGWLASFVALIICLLSTTLMMVSGIILTAGLSKFCDLIHQQIPSCEDAQFIDFKMPEDIYKKTFYVEFGMAQVKNARYATYSELLKYFLFGVWTSMLCWGALSIVASYKLYTFHKQEDFFISMRRERERLIQRVSNSRTETI